MFIVCLYFKAVITFVLPKMQKKKISFKFNYNTLLVSEFRCKQNSLHLEMCGCHQLAKSNYRIVRKINWKFFHNILFLTRSLSLVLGGQSTSWAKYGHVESISHHEIHSDISSIFSWSQNWNKASDKLIIIWTTWGQKSWKTLSLQTHSPDILRLYNIMANY